MFFKYTLILSFLVFPLHAILTEDEDPISHPQHPVQKATSFDRVRGILAMQRQAFEERGALHSFSTYLIPEDLTDENIKDLSTVLGFYENDQFYKENRGFIYVSTLLQQENFPKLPLDTLLKFLHVIMLEEVSLQHHHLSDEQIEAFFMDYLPTSVAKTPGLSVVDCVISGNICGLVRPYVTQVYNEETAEFEEDSDPSDS